jgi:hypothetical protein
MIELIIVIFAIISLLLISQSLILIYKIFRDYFFNKEEDE